MSDCTSQSIGMWGGVYSLSGWRINSSTGGLWKEPHVLKAEAGEEDDAVGCMAMCMDGALLLRSARGVQTSVLHCRRESNRSGLIVRHAKCGEKVATAAAADNRPYENISRCSAQLKSHTSNQHSSMAAAAMYDTTALHCASTQRL